VLPHRPTPATTISRSRVFSIGSLFSQYDVRISGLTITGRNADVGGGVATYYNTLLLSGVVIDGNTGGGIYNDTGSVSLVNSTVSNNTSATDAGGITNLDGGYLSAVNTTISGNFGSQGGGIFSEGFVDSSFIYEPCTIPSLVTLTNVTMAGNSATAGAGVYNYLASSLTLVNTIADNSGPQVTNDDGGLSVYSPLYAPAIVVQGPNLVEGGLDGFPDVLSADPKFGQLQDNGGPTPTMALLEGSPAINAGDGSLLPDGTTTDQRGEGFPRIRGDAVDLGAYEFSAPPTILSFNVPASGAEGSPVNLQAAATDPDSSVLTYVWTVDLPDGTDVTLTGDQTSYTPDDNGTYDVSLSVHDSDGLTSATSETDVVVANVAPAASITGSPVSGHSPEGTAISLGSSVTDPSSADTAAGFTYAWSVTKNGAAYALGSAATFSFTPDDNGTYVVTLTATDKDSGISAPSQATILVDNVALTAGGSGPSDGVRGQARTFTLTASDPSAVDQAAGFTFAITWGDGSTQTVSGPSGTQVSHVYTASGAYIVKVTAQDKDSGTSAAPTETDTITAVALETDPTDPSKTALCVGGTAGGDNITIKPADPAGLLNVKIGTTNLGSFRPTGHVIV
jgi:hypothetical protein